MLTLINIETDPLSESWSIRTCSNIWFKVKEYAPIDQDALKRSDVEIFVIH